MPKMFTSGFKPKSTTKKAKEIIRKEMLGYFSAKDYGVKSNLQAMKVQADFAADPRYDITDYRKARRLVDGGSLACYYSDQSKTLAKIYGKENVEKWDGNKIHSTYSHLVGREYSSMLAEKQKIRSLKKK